jgi:hypothetical protein
MAIARGIGNGCWVTDDNDDDDDDDDDVLTGRAGFVDANGGGGGISLVTADAGPAVSRRGPLVPLLAQRGALAMGKSKSISVGDTGERARFRSVSLGATRRSGDT